MLRILQEELLPRLSQALSAHSTKQLCLLRDKIGHENE